MLHGGHSNCFEELGYDNLLEAGFSLLTPSRPGYGQTPVEVGPTAQEFADAMINLLDDLGIEQVSVIAFSAAGLTGISLAARHPDRVNKLVLESAVTKRWLSKEDKLYQTAQRLFNPKTQNYTWWMLRTMASLFPKTVVNLMIPSFSTLPLKEVQKSISPEQVKIIQRMIQRQSSGRGFMLDLEHDISDTVLKSIVVPTLIVHSRYDNSVPFEYALHAVACIKGAELFEAQTWGHLIWLGAGAQAVNEKVINFLK